MNINTKFMRLLMGELNRTNCYKRTSLNLNMEATCDNDLWINYHNNQRGYLFFAMHFGNKPVDD